MNDDIRRSWEAATRWDAPRHPFPWRAVRVPNPHPPPVGTGSYSTRTNEPIPAQGIRPGEHPDPAGSTRERDGKLRTSLS